MQHLSKPVAVPQPAFLQTTFAQNVMPLVTSIMLHVGVIVAGFATVHVVSRTYYESREQWLIPDSGFLADGPEGGIAHPGLEGDPDRDATQDRFPDVAPQSMGLAPLRGDALATIEGGPNSEIIAALGWTVSRGHGKTSGEGSDAGGVIAPFGVPGGGAGMGPRSWFIGCCASAHRVVFICDCTGSMTESFDRLRGELHKSIEPMRSPQAANVVFMHQGAAPPAGGLLLLTPANKRLLLAGVDAAIPSGPTDPDAALRAAFAMGPELIYFLADPSDFPYPPGTIELCKTLNPQKRTKIITFAFKSHDGEATLQQIAADSGGRYKFVAELAE